MEAIVIEHEAGLLRYAARLLNDPTTAQDVVQEVFLKLFQGWKDGARPTAQLKSWLYRATHNRAVDHIRRESRLRILHKKQAERHPPSFPALQRRQMEEREMKAFTLAHLKLLDPAERQIVILRLQEGMTYREIAEITDRSEESVRYTLFRAVRKLSKSLKQAGVIGGSEDE